MPQHKITVADVEYVINNVPAIEVASAFSHYENKKLLFDARGNTYQLYVDGMMTLMTTNVNHAVKAYNNA